MENELKADLQKIISKMKVKNYDSNKIICVKEETALDNGAIILPLDFVLITFNDLLDNNNKNKKLFYKRIGDGIHSISSLEIKLKKEISIE